ncbi:MAG: tRNA (adenosine(37)-N6)-threonylcarbamoyltransferase complex transferase subunit TsaD [Planctomycetes bacterium]|nr:tRNA (adenosine(37)-N6)-threonylcarbamoyltransferase complex transferase subunit TsaD [Planctomycetota bacterium]MCH9726775.1 tRNA (adenosine(37)-N6)-threonylcarbamoyltransferase complex transferase subunit TsaD [Planctomycetota bacterium]MCH9776800.1 tRNA (adenosine(37)-N6)-threonylcarbamoyltransferase complex transferase subunit TsaD [Planctomycetota bacterium]MCH9792894.1 tRNA (adenosine(37)-N6)-threonylcarbamoyltransferase complex transferase subunit TsaD [Planctomycetota bacterium]MDF17
MNQPKEYLLAIESSCDETAAAVITRDMGILSNIVSSQIDLHEKFGGVVPEIASRAHLERILPVIDEALKQAGISLNQLTAIAVATEPGLVGSLLIGLTAAKTLAMTLDLPLIAVNHIEGHLFACQMQETRPLFPAIGLVVSGGHTNLYHCSESFEFKLIGATIDDAAGEAFDKVAKILGLAYPGGPSIQKSAVSGNPKAFPFPRTFLKDPELRFSFSGLKTAVLYTALGNPGAKKQPPPLTPERIADLAASFQETVVDVLVGKCQQALKQYNYSTLCVGGGVAANTLLRERLAEMTKEEGIYLSMAPLDLCTDNAAMAAIAWHHLDQGRIADLDLDVNPGLVR